MSPQPVPLSAIPTLSHLYRTTFPLSAIITITPTSPYPDSAAHNATLSLLRTDITTLGVSCIQNAANSSLLGGGGVDGAIHRRAGPKLMQECRTLGGCEVGDAKVTKGYELPAEMVVHTVAPIWGERKDQWKLKAGLRSCYARSFEEVKKAGGRSLALCCAGTGVYGWDSAVAAEIVAGEVRGELDRLERQEGEGNGWRWERVVVCCFEEKDLKAYERVLPYFFPPTDEDWAARKRYDAGEASPTHAEDATVAKSEGQTEDDEEEEWEEVDKLEASAQNGAKGLGAKGEVSATSSTERSSGVASEGGEGLGKATGKNDGAGTVEGNRLGKDW